VPNGQVTGNNKVWKQISFSPITTSKMKIVITGTADSYSRLAEVEAWGTAVPASRADVAASANGATATASETNSAPYAPSGAINGDRKFYTNNAWANSTATYPQWLQVDFNGSKLIDEIDVFSIQDNPGSPSEPTLSMTFNNYGLTAFEVQYWNGSSWLTVPNGQITGNNKVWKQLAFSPITTSKLKIIVNATPDGYSRIAEVEAWGGPAGSAADLRWLITDHLGTPRMVLDQTGALSNMTRHDYLPFGEELFAPTSGRSAAQGYSGSDSLRQQFTSQERDIETSLDYFFARPYSSVQGRFLGPDPLLTSAKRGQPQSWNRYTYGLDSPGVYIDPLGLVWAYVETVSNGVRTRTYTWYATNDEVPETATIVTSNYDSLGPGLFSSIYLGNGPDNWRHISYEEFERGVIAEIADEMNRYFLEAAQRAKEQEFQNGWVAGFLFLVENQQPSPPVSPTGNETASDGDIEITKPVRVRHYTSISGRRGIEQAGVIRAYDQNSVFGVRANKRMAPRDAEERLGLRRGRGNAFVEFDAQPSEFTIIQRSNGVREFRFSGDVNLTDRFPTFHFNR
jgi:RHS repeat-associated protein